VAKTPDDGALGALAAVFEGGALGVAGGGASGAWQAQQTSNSSHQLERESMATPIR